MICTGFLPAWGYFVENYSTNLVDPSGHSPCGAYCEGEAHSAEDEADWEHPAVGKYYYEYYMNNPDAYLLAVLNDPADDTLFAAEAYAEVSLGEYLRPFGVESPGVWADAWQELRARVHAGETELTDQAAVALFMVVGEMGFGEFADQFDGLGSSIDFSKLTYSPKVLSQMKTPDFHGFPRIVDNYINTSYAQKYLLTGDDGLVRMVVDIPGGYMGREGVFRYIIEPDFSVNHRMFHPFE